MIFHFGKFIKTGLIMGVAAFVLSGVLTGCGNNGSEQQGGGKSKGKVVLLSWGGTVDKMFNQMGMAEEFKKETGYELELVPKSDSAAIIQTAIAQKDKPQVDVVMCDAGSLISGDKQGLFVPMKDVKLSNSDDILPMTKHDNYLYVYFAIPGIVYNEDVFKQNGWAAPTSLDDLFDPKFKGKVAFDHFPSSYAESTLLLWSEQNGGSIDNVKPGFDKLAKLAPDIYEFSPNTNQMISWLASGDVDIAMYSHIIVKELQRRGIHAGFVIPKEGAYVEPTAAGIMKNSPNPEGAQALLNFLISKEFLQKRYETFGDIPANSKVQLDDSTGISWDTLKTLKVFDYDKLVKDVPGWVDTFNAQIVSIPKAF